MTTPILSIRNVRKSFASDGLSTEVLKNVSLDIAPGVFAAVVGRSGSGKSTLLNVASTLLHPDSGEVLHDGRPIDYSSEAEINGLRRTGLAMIFQMHHLMPYLTALENVLLPFMSSLRLVSRDQATRAREALARVGLGDKTNRLPGKLSGGEQQRVAIARALVKSPRLLFADEPTGSLDKRTGESIVDLLRELNQDGLTVLMVTHETEYARHADLVAEMEDGVLQVR